MIKKIVLSVVGLVAVGLMGFAAVATMQPDDFKITRATLIQAPAEEVFAQVNDFHNWGDWSPWAKLDPQCQETFSGPASGKGAVFAWAGNDEVGEGKMTITESRPPERILIDLEFIKPFEGKNLTEFTFESQGKQTMVSWSMAGKNNFVGKAMGLLLNCEKMIGDQFEQGFANLKAKVERSRQ